MTEESTARSLADAAQGFADAAAVYAKEASWRSDTLEGRNNQTAAYFMAALADAYAEIVAGVAAQAAGRLQSAIADAADGEEVRAAMSNYQWSRQAAAATDLAAVRAYRAAVSADPRE